MYTDYKKRRAVTRGIQTMELRQEKHVDPEALKRFREVPFQLKYARKLKDGGNEDEIKEGPTRWGILPVKL